MATGSSSGRNGLDPGFIESDCNTSRECRVCGHTEKANRKTRDLFACLSCGHTADADVNAARVIARRAEVIRPYGDIVDVVASHRDDLQSSAL